jgi:DNA-directed RNA polymerase specialized sigma subunit
MRTRYSNVWLLAEMQRCRGEGEISPELGEVFVDICTRGVRRRGHQSLTYVDDMIAHAVLQLCADWTKFDPSKSSNPFAYLTQVASGACCVYIHRERRQEDIAPVSLNVLPNKSTS